MNLNEFKDAFNSSKKYWLVYLVLIIVLGLSTRYFIPLFGLFPIIGTFRIKKMERYKETMDKYAIVFIIAFMAVMILSFATKYY